MGMYNLIEDNVNKFWDLAELKAGECESLEEFREAMTAHVDLLQGSSEGECWEDTIAEAWDAYWAECWAEYYA